MVFTQQKQQRKGGGNVWETMVEKALVNTIKACYEMYMALNMDKDITSHKAEGMPEMFTYLQDMVTMHNEFKV